MINKTQKYFPNKTFQYRIRVFMDSYTYYIFNIFILYKAYE